MRGGRWVFRVRTEAAMTNVRVGPYTLFRPNDILRAGAINKRVDGDALSGPHPRCVVHVFSFQKKEAGANLSLCLMGDFTPGWCKIGRN